MKKDKTCSKCKLNKPINEFYWQRAKNCYQYICKKCHNIGASYRQKRRHYFQSKLGKEAWNRASKKALEKYPEKWKARALLREAVRKGKIIKPKYCEKIILSSTLCKGRIEAHHYLGYEGEHWKDVQWLCVKHHKEADINLSKHFSI